MKRKRRAAAPLRRGPAVLLGDGCLLLLVLAGTVFSFLTAFSVQIHALPLLLGCAAAALAFLGLWSLPRRWWALPLALLAAAWLLAVRRLWQPLALGADALRVDVVNTVSASLELGFTLEPALSLPEALWTNCATLLVLLALVPLGALLGLGVVRLRSFWLVFVSSFPFVLLPLCISVTPGWLPLMALVLGWVVPALTSLLARTSPLGAARLNLAALPAAALLLAALSLAMPMDTYQRPAWADRALQHLTNQAVRLGDGLLEGSGPFGIGSGGGRLADADGSVSLSDAGPLRFSGRTVLEVETDLTGRIYLRGLSDAVYDGESWQPLDEAAYNWQARLRGVTYGAPVTLDMDLGVTGAESLFAQFQPMNFPALAVRDAHPESPYARITVRNVGADPGYVYVPYHILTQPGELSGAEFVHDAYLARAARVWTHTIYVQPDASPAASAGLRGELSLAEAAYADFVREYYLQVPLYSENPALRQALDGALEPLADWLRQAQYVSPAAVKQPYELEAAQVVADYLAAVAEYDPDTPAAPEGEDFVAWFLTESHRGYCMHFASAAVLLLRSMGVPARYVSGFVADVPASGRVNVPDSAAHAWVEVYIDGYGWEPVEVTPVYAGSTPAQSGAEEPEAPRCFEVERRLKEVCDIPVFHDDQHGTAIVVAAALLNAMRVTGKQMGQMKIVINGAGAAGIAIGKLLISMGFGNIVMCDINGIICEGDEGLNAGQEEISHISNREHEHGTLADALRGADAFVGVSRPNLVTAEMVSTMKDGIVFAMANPTPEIMPDEAKRGGAAVVGTGRSDFPNQINNVMVFPGIFKGALAVRAREITEGMKIRAARALAALVTDEQLSADYILPSALDKSVADTVARAVAQEAREQGIARA